jgi:hypothetical protein
MARKAKYGVSRRLPEITARDGLPVVPLVLVHPRAVPANLTRVETFPGAACLRRFPVVHALRQIRGSSGTFQSGSPPGVDTINSPLGSENLSPDGVFQSVSGRTRLQ